MIDEQRPFRFARTVQERFEDFHRENPRIYAFLVRFAKEAKSAGKRKYSVWAIFNRIRWHVEIETRGDEFKLNNDFISRYSRLIMQQEPDLVDFFETRELKVD